jgi:hypothetical protein
VLGMGTGQRRDGDERRTWWGWGEKGKWSLVFIYKRAEDANRIENEKVILNK